MTTKAPRIGLELHADGRVIVAPLDYLGREIFGAYRLACGQHGARYDAAMKASIVLPDLVPGLVAALKLAGTAPVVSQGLAERLRGRATETREEMTQAQARLSELTAHLAERGLTLYPFQVSGVAWLETKTTALLADEMGLGKTVQAAMSLRRDACRAIVTCPASLKGNWVRELARWRPELMPVVLAGRGSFVWPQVGQVVILNPDIMPIVEEEGEDGAVVKLKPYEDCPPDLDLVADECHAYKSSKAKRTKSFKALARAVRKAGGRTWGLTGTPILNRPEELHALLSAFDLLKSTFGDYPAFCAAFSAKKKHFGGNEWGEAGPSVGPILKRVMLRRRREEVLPDLPTKTRDTLPVDVDRKTRDLCAATRAAIEAAGISLEEVVETGKMGAAFEAISKTRAALAAAKVPAMLELIEEHEEEGQAVVVFSAHKAPIQALAGRAGWATFTGETSAEERTRIVADFQAGKYKGLATTIGAGGVGHTMTYAHHMLFVDQDWTPAMNNQAEDRCCRIGQDRGVIIRILTVPDTIDEDVAAILMRKQRLIDGSIEKATSKASEIPQAVAPEMMDAAAKNAADFTRPDRTRRRPVGALEDWAAAGLRTLAERRAFKERDREFGASVAAQLGRQGELTEKQWQAAVRMCRGYQEVVGGVPEAA